MTKQDLIPIAAFIGLMAIPVLLGAIAILRLFNRGLNRAAESDLTGINAIPAHWPPSDSLSREYEQEPRGM